MAFRIVCYQNTGEVNRVDKSDYITPVGVYAGSLRGECSLQRPSIILELESTPNFNYIQIQEFSRYYFVTSITSINTSLWRVDLNCDVLMSFKDGIKALSASIARQENVFNPYLIDNLLPAQKNSEVLFVDPETDYNAFGNYSAGMYNFVLTVVGGETSVNP